MSSPPDQPQPTALKRQPKATFQRRTQAERDRLKHEEDVHEQKRARQAAEDAALEKRARDQRYGFDSRNRGAAARGSRGARGGFMGDSARTRFVEPPVAPPSAPAVPRGGATAARAGRPSGAGRGAKATPRARTEGKVKVEGEASAAPASAAPAPANVSVSEAPSLVPLSQQPDIYVISDDDDEEYGHPKDIDYINISSDEDEGRVGEGVDDMEVDGAPQDKKPARLRSLMPVRVDRQEHVDRQIGINTESSAATATGTKRGTHDLILSDDSDDEAQRRRRESKGKGRRPVMKSESGTAKDAADTSPDEARAKAKPTQRSSKGPAFQTDEERIEWEIRQQDLQNMVDELDQGATLLSIAGGEAPTEEQQRRQMDIMDKGVRRDNNIFLLQIPPVMPDLQATGAKVSKGDNKKKMDDDEAATSTKPPGLKQEEEEVLVKEGEDAEATAAAMLAGEQPDEAVPRAQPGYAGKMRVRQSGRTTLSWGGSKMRVHAGMNAGFLQTAIMARTRPVDAKDDDGRVEGSALSMGQVRGKFVAAPDLDALLR